MIDCICTINFLHHLVRAKGDCCPDPSSVLGTNKERHPPERQGGGTSEYPSADMGLERREHVTKYATIEKSPSRVENRIRERGECPTCD